MEAETGLPAVATWCLEQFAERLAEVFEAMAGVRPAVQLAAATEPASEPESQGLRWRQRFHGAAGAMWVDAAEKDWTEAGSSVMRAAGIDDADGPTLKSTWVETLGQALSSLARDFSSRLGHEVTCGEGGESTEARAAPGSTPWTRLSLQFGEGAAAIHILCSTDETLLKSLTPQPEKTTAAAASAGAPATPAGPAPADSTSTAAKTFDLLLDVELPVSVSFGRAQVALKDVIKLTTGAIVELNRSITEPVEVIVNNCVIARGEVVVVEGNFGVRIREVISRQDRLRTLN